MNGFLEECWENLWSGLTPLFTVVLFLIGIKLGGMLAGYFNTKWIWFLMKFGLSFIFAACVPVFATLSKK